MKVTDANVNFAHQAYAREAKNLPAEKLNSRKTGTTAAVPRDKVSLSDNSKDINLAIETAKAAPDVRDEMVNRLKSEVESGSYKVDARQIAGKLVGGTLNETI